jgi:hypothetical protein
MAFPPLLMVGLYRPDSVFWDYTLRKIREERVPNMWVDYTCEAPRHAILSIFV